MSQTVREIAESAAHWIASHYQDGIEHEIGKGNLPFAEAVIKGELESRFAGHVLASTEPLAMTGIDNGSAESEARDRISERGFAQYERECADLREQLKKSKEPLGDDLLRNHLSALRNGLSRDWRTAADAIEIEIRRLQAENADLEGANLPLYSDRIRNLENAIADLRAQIQAAGQEAHKTFARHQEVVDNMLAGLAAYEEQVLSLQQLADERVAALEYWQNRAQYWKDRGAQFIEAASHIGVVFSKSADGIKADNPRADERGREVERKAWALDAVREAMEHYTLIEPCGCPGSECAGDCWSAKFRELVEKCDSVATPAAMPQEHRQQAMRFRVGRKISTTVYRGEEEQPCAWVPGDPHLAARIVELLNISDDHNPATPPAQEHPATAVERIIRYFAELQNDGYDFDGNGWDKEPLRECILEIIAARTAPEAQR